MKKRITIGIIAHVDAGKTTLSEALLYTAGIIKKQGRVDKRDTFLDNHELERERGITIFSKMARMSTEKSDFTFLDTPGHVDFSAETERTLSVLDYAILVISGSEGVQAHTETLWKLLEKYNVPTFIFVTKMDIIGADKSRVLSQLNNKLDSRIVDYKSDNLFETAALCDEELLEQYSENGKLNDNDFSNAITKRNLFLCFFGSGLKLEGVNEFLDALDRLTLPKLYSNEFAAKVYKIGHDKSGKRLTYMKITGGSISVRQLIDYSINDEKYSEKVTEIRLYSGIKYQTADKAEAGEICAVTGLTKTYCHQGLGNEKNSADSILIPVLNYRMELPPDIQPVQFLPKLRELEEEEPLLHIVWDERYEEIHAQIMGQVQTEIISRLISDRYNVDVKFTDGRILYRETISDSVEAVGHFEPLRHYAEVHLLLEPLEVGQGLIFECDIPENSLDLNWQNLILTHLKEKTHIGVLCGYPITDMKISLVSGRAHLKHTQGGDFREATYRAIRQGLMTLKEKNSVILLEPYYAYKIELPTESVGRAITDITNKGGSIDIHETIGEISLLSGKISVFEMSDYPKELHAYTHGKGVITYRVDGYYPCHNSDYVIENMAYNPECDTANTADSVFCAHGSGFIVPWKSVPRYMHIDYRNKINIKDSENSCQPRLINGNFNIDDKELEAIMDREFGPIKRRKYSEPQMPYQADNSKKIDKKLIYIIDAYNVIFAWEELSAIAEYDLESARHQLCEILSNYKAFTGRDIILVFDAYKVKGNERRKENYNGISVVYTKEGELGDTYIEKLIYEIGENNSVRVVTSDSMIQLRALSSGMLRISAREFKEEIIKTDAEIEALLKKLLEKK